MTVWARNVHRCRSRLVLVGQAVLLGLALPVLIASSCGTDNALLLPERDNTNATPAGARLIARFVHLTDTHVIDAESPARCPGTQTVIPSAWRAWESSSAQLLDGAVRAANRVHASGDNVDFLLHTGDACDNSQGNELNWAVQVMDGGQVATLTGPDDRDPATIPPPEMDPYAPFHAQGLYRTGVHGPLPSIAWYAARGNHETLGMGVFPIIAQWDGTLVSPMPLSVRPGILLPTVLDPTGWLSYGPISPAHPGPPPLLDFPSVVTPVAERHYFTTGEYLQKMFETVGGPAGHGFVSPEGPLWYSLSPVAGLRLITLYTSDLRGDVPGLPYQEGSISQEQVDFLKAELNAAQERGEWVIVVSHHPSSSLEVLYGSALGPETLRNLLNQYPNVIAHVAGHSHRNRVADRGGYIEIETCSTLDWPQEERVIEIWSQTDGSVGIVYHMLSVVDNDLPPLGEDPLLGLRQQAHAMAHPGKSAENQRRGMEPADPNPQGELSDREGVWHKPS